MSRPAPHFSATVIGARLLGGWIESSALDVINVGGAEKCLASPDGAADPPIAAALPSPKNVFFNARSVNAATSTMPAPVIQTAHGKVFHVPMRMVISAANPLKPGIPIDAADAMTNANAANGNARPNPMVESASRSRVWVRR